MQKPTHLITRVPNMSRLRFEGCQLFRQRIVAATLSGKSIRIDKIRDEDDSPGLQDFEANFLRLVEKLTDGCAIEINETGTSLRYKPGLISGGRIVHDCGMSRAIGWFIEGILPLVVFGKDNSSIAFTGVTNDALDFSVDVLRNVTLPFLRNFGVEGASLTIKKRGAAPLGGGAVDFYCPIVRQLVPINVTDMGLIKRVRGLVFCTRISPTVIVRVVDSARGVLNNLLPDVYIHADHYKGAEGGKSPGYSLSLVAESTTGVLISVERTAGEADAVISSSSSSNSSSSSSSSSKGRPELPETVGEEGAYRLLEEIRKGGIIDSAHQPLVLMMMVVTPEDVSKVRFGELTDQAVRTLRLIREAFGVTFKIKEDPAEAAAASAMERKVGLGAKRPASSEGEDDEDDDNDDDEEEGRARNGKKQEGQGGNSMEIGRTFFLSCLGTGYVNMSRKIR